MTEDARRQLEELYRYQVDAVQSALARRLGRENAEDLVSRGLIRLADRMEREPVKNAPALFGTIVAGLEKNFYRDRDKRRERELPVDFEWAENAVGVPTDESGDFRDSTRNMLDQLVDAVTIRELSPDDVQFREDFDRSVRALDTDERDAFILTELRGLPMREAADVLDTSKDTVHRRAEAARNTLKGALSSA